MKANNPDANWLYCIPAGRVAGNQQSHSQEKIMVSKRRMPRKTMHGWDLYHWPEKSICKRKVGENAQWGNVQGAKVSQYGTLHTLISLLCPKQVGNRVWPQKGNQMEHNRQGALARGAIARQSKPLQKHTHQANSSSVKRDTNSLQGTNNEWGQVQEGNYQVHDRKRGPNVVSRSAWAGPQTCSKWYWFQWLSYLCWHRSEISTRMSWKMLTYFSSSFFPAAGQDPKQEKKPFHGPSFENMARAEMNHWEWRKS